MRLERALGARWLYRMDEARALSAGLPDEDSWGLIKRLLVGRTHALLGDHARAVAEYEAALALASEGRTYREDLATNRSAALPAIATSRLAVELHELGEPDAGRMAEKGARLFSSLDQAARDYAHPIVAFDRGELAESPDEALRHHREARALRERAWGPSAPATTESRVRCLELGDRDDDPRALSQRVERELGAAHPWRARLERVGDGEGGGASRPRRGV